MSTLEDIKKEFYENIADFSDENRHVEPYSAQKIADFFLSKYKLLLSELVGEVEELGKVPTNLIDMETGLKNGVYLIDILSLINKKMV